MGPLGWAPAIGAVDVQGGCSRAHGRGEGVRATIKANQLGADTLMKRAGAAAAELIMKRLEDAGVEQRRVTLLVGPGNNGGDALACACELREKGAVVNVVLPGGRRPISGFGGMGREWAPCTSTT